MKKDLLIIAGPSAGGKTTVAECLMGKDSRFCLVRSVTTRAPRGDGKDEEYIYLTPEEFDKALATGEILESMVYSGQCYGTPRSELERALAEGRIPLLILDLNGVVALTDNGEYSSCVIYVYTDLNTAEQRLYSRYLGNGPTPKGLASFVSRKERNIKDFLDLPALSPRFYSFVENMSDIESATDGVAEAFASYLEGVAADHQRNLTVAEQLARSAQEKQKL